MWTVENRARCDRSKLRCPTDLTDADWALVVPLISPAKRGGNQRTVNMREVADALMYVLGTGCQWRAIPKDLAPRSTAYGCFSRWDWDGTLGRIHHALYVQCRELGVSRSESAWAGREASPTAAIVDAEKSAQPIFASQSVKGAEKGGLHRPQRLRRGQEGPGQEAPRPCGRAGLADARHRLPWRRHPGPLATVKRLRFAKAVTAACC